MDDNAAWALLQRLVDDGAYVSVVSGPLWAGEQRWCCQVFIKGQEFRRWAPDRIGAIEKTLTQVAEGGL